MVTSTIINIIGLSFDIIGVVLLFFYEPPKQESHALLMQSAPSKEDREKVRNTKRRFSVLGLTLLIIGFSLQIISNFF
jgi:accessory gene regulator protein AgrB